jgi:anti-sigma regulatory factor (Ser/Thr protein kinase)
MHKIILPAKPEHLATINRFLEEEVPAEFSGRLNGVMLAVEELLMNIFHYAYSPEVDGQAQIDCRLAYLDGQAYFCVHLCDWGRPYNPFAEAPVPDLHVRLEDRPIGGLGLYLVKKFATHYVYSRCADTNDVELFFAAG